MIPRPHYEFPENKQESLRRAVRLEWISLSVMLSITVLMALTLGGSEAMKTSFAENTLGMIPPLSFLISLRFRKRPPDETYPFGYQRATNVAFLCGALALCSFGLLLFLDAARHLITQERPVVGAMSLFGHTVWQGWPMIAVLAYSAVLPGLLGRKKLPLARDLHDKALHTDASMNRADWMSDSAAILGVLGIAVGWWWADSLAAGLISLDICRDGWANLRESVGDMMDRRPITVDDEDEDLPRRIEETLQGLDWVAEAAVRVREDGSVYSGEALLVPRDPHADSSDLMARLEEAREKVHALDWQLYELVLMPVASLDVARRKPPPPEARQDQEAAEQVAA